jgi:tetratricopeptide (TPR) repeat protein
MDCFGATATGMTRSVSTALFLCCATLACSDAAEPEGSVEARMALEECCAVERLPSGEQAVLLERGLVGAELAVAADPADPVAHLAVFCYLGKRVRRDGLSLRALGAVRRLLREIDTALTLAPDFPAALAAKGALLASLPRLLGGDPTEGERLARQAVRLAPEDAEARLTLIDVLERRGRHDDAEAERKTLVRRVEGGERGGARSDAGEVVAQLPP